MNSRNTRKFRIWDSDAIFEGYGHAAQVVHNIDDRCKTAQISPDALPMSVIPSEVLYNLMICYQAMYNKLLDESLIQNSHPQSTHTKH